MMQPSCEHVCSGMLVSGFRQCCAHILCLGCPTDSSDTLRRGLVNLDNTCWVHGFLPLAAAPNMQHVLHAKPAFSFPRGYLMGTSRLGCNVESGCRSGWPVCSCGTASALPGACPEAAGPRASWAGCCTAVSTARSSPKGARPCVLWHLQQHAPAACLQAAFGFPRRICMPWQLLAGLRQHEK